MEGYMWNSYELNDFRKIEFVQTPNYFITGKSIPAIERAGIKLAEEIEGQRLIRFKGIVKHFTIKTPYWIDRETLKEFRQRLVENISIARDCYDRFSGIVIIECSELWTEQNITGTLDLLIDYIRDNEQICFIFLVPVTKKSKYADQLYSKLLQCGTWFRIIAKTPTIQQCVSYFQQAAREQGYEVLEEAKQALHQQLEERDEFRTENIEVAKQLIKQIIFNHRVERDSEKIICAQDVMCTGDAGIGETHKTIGFVIEER